MTVQLPRHLFTVDDYYRMAASGILRADDRVELIEGEIIEMVPIGSHHASAVDRLASMLIRGTAPDQITVRVQGPIRLSDRSEPQPDISLLAPKSYVESHPAPEDARLLIEVADSFLLFDKMVKVPLYASFAIPEVWVVDLTANSVDIYRNPTPQGYESQISAQRGDQIAPMSLPSLSLAVADILG